MKTLAVKIPTEQYEKLTEYFKDKYPHEKASRSHGMRELLSTLPLDGINESLKKTILKKCLSQLSNFNELCIFFNSFNSQYEDIMITDIEEDYYLVSNDETDWFYDIKDALETTMPNIIISSDETNAIRLNPNWKRGRQ